MDVNNRQTSEDASKPHTLGLLGHSVLRLGRKKIIIRTKILKWAPPVKRLPETERDFMDLA